MDALPRGGSRPRTSLFRGKDRPRRLRDSQGVRRRRGVAGLTLVGLGIACLVAGAVTARADSPPMVEVTAQGVTEVPPTHFFQQPWVLFGAADDPRRVPDLSEVGCRPLGPLSTPVQPKDLTQFGSRVVDDQPIHALAVLSRSGEGAALECDGAQAHAPLWLMPVSEAPTLTPTAITIFAFALLIAGGLTHPATADLRFRRRLGSGHRHP